MIARKPVSVKVGEDSVEVRTKHQAHEVWRASGKFRGGYFYASGSSESDAIQRLQKKFCEEHYLYVLALADECFYVGRTTNLRMRLWEHFKTKIHKSAWTLSHRPVSVVHVSRIEGTKLDLDRIETSATLRLAKLKGFDKVRGGGYTAATVRESWLAALEGVPPADETKFRPLGDEKLKAMIKNAYHEYVKINGRRGN